MNGGHLGSNLGAVELTLALHRVFDSPRDAIVWDTGHQSYVHKLVTGRRRRLQPPAPGRRPLGVPVPGRVGARPGREQPRVHRGQLRLRPRGRPRRGRGERGDDTAVVAVIGDGALTGGLAYEALNNFGATGRRAVIVLNDNGRCYAPTVSRLTLAGPASGDAGDPAAFFAALGLDYVGPIDGHDIAALEPVLRDAAARERPGRRARAHAQGRGLPPGRDRRGEAPPRHRRVRPRDRRARRRERVVVHGRIPRRARSRSRRSDPRSSPSPRACRDPPACCPSPSASPTAASTSASPSSTRSPPPRAWRCAACARWSPSTPRSSAGRGTRCSTTSGCTACPSCSASTAPASPATTARATTGSTTSRCSPRCRASRSSRRRRTRRRR